MATFTLLVSLLEFDLDPRPGVTVNLSTSPKRYPVAGVGVLETIQSQVTDAEGKATFANLQSLPGLRYIVEAGDSAPVSISGAGRTQGQVVRLDSETSATPSPIAAVDAAALRAEFAALLEGVEGGSGTVGPTGPAGPQGAQGPTGPAGATGPQGSVGPAGPAGATGPQGPAGADGVGGGSDSMIIVNGGTVTLDEESTEGSLFAYRVKADTTFVGAAGETTLPAGAYTFERTDTGWMIYASEGTALGTGGGGDGGGELPAGWSVIGSDDFAGTDGQSLYARPTTVGSLTWTGDDSEPVITGNKVMLTPPDDAATMALAFPSASTADAVEVTVDYLIRDQLNGALGGMTITLTDSPAISLRRIDNDDIKMRVVGYDENSSPNFQFGPTVVVPTTGTPTGGGQSGTLKIRRQGNTLTVLTSAEVELISVDLSTAWVGYKDKPTPTTVSLSLSNAQRGAIDGIAVRAFVA